MLYQPGPSASVLCDVVTGIRWVIARLRAFLLAALPDWDPVEKVRSRVPCVPVDPPELDLCLITLFSSATLIIFSVMKTRANGGTCLGVLTSIFAEN